MAKEKPNRHHYTTLLKKMEGNDLIFNLQFSMAAYTAP